MYVLTMEQAKISPQYLWYVSNPRQSPVVSPGNLGFSSNLIAANNVLPSIQTITYKQPSVDFGTIFTPGNSANFTWISLVNIVIDFVTFCQNKCPANLYFNPIDIMCYDICPIGYVGNDIT